MPVMQEATAVTLSEGDSHPLKAAGGLKCTTVLFSLCSDIYVHDYGSNL